MKTVNFIALCFGIVLIPVVMSGGIILISVYGQTPTQTTELTSPNPNLQYVPQKAYIVPLGPNGQMQVIPYQESSTTSNNDLMTIFTGLLGLGGVASGFWAKITGSKANKETKQEMTEKVRDNTLAIVESKEVEHSIAKQVFKNMPDGGASINDAPEIKLEKLQQNKEEAAKLATKA